MIHLEPDILECKVKWALGSIAMNKASGGDGIWAISNPKIWCHESAALNMPANLENSAVATGLEKALSFSSTPKKGNAKECSNYCTIALISHISRVMLKILQTGFSNTWTENFQMLKLDLEKAEEPEIKLPTSIGSLKKRESSRKTSNSTVLTMPKPLCWSQQTVENSKRDGTNRPEVPPEKSVCKPRSNS